MNKLSSYVIETILYKVEYLNSDKKPIKFKNPALRAVKVNTKDYNSTKELMKALLPFLGGKLSKVNNANINRTILYLYIKDGNVVARVKLPDSTEKVRTFKPGEDKNYSFKYADIATGAINKIKSLKPGEPYYIINKYAKAESWALIAYLINLGIGVIVEYDSMKYISDRKRLSPEDAKYGFDNLMDFLNSSKNYMQAYVKDGVLWLYSGN